MKLEYILSTWGWFPHDRYYWLAQCKIGSLRTYYGNAKDNVD